MEEWKTVYVCLENLLSKEIPGLIQHKDGDLILFDDKRYEYLRSTFAPERHAVTHIIEVFVFSEEQEEDDEEDDDDWL